MAVTKYFAIDAATIFRDVGEAAVTASGYIGTQIDQDGATATDMIAVINVEAISAGGNQTYLFSVVGSNATDRSDAEILGQITLGAASAVDLETVDREAGDREEIRCRSEKNDRRFRYLDLHLEAGGTSPSITFNAFLSKEVA